MVKIYNGAKTTFQLTAEDGSTLRIPHSSFAQVDDKYLGDITYRTALASGAFTLFDTVKEGDAAERTAEKKSKGKKVDDAK